MEEIAPTSNFTPSGVERDKAVEDVLAFLSSIFDT